MTKWNTTPALGTILAQMATLYARAVRVELVKREQNAARIAAMLGVNKSK
jgi:hypothetical protein